MNKKEIIKIVDNNTFCFETEDEFDTKVTLNGNLLCWISFPDLDNFVKGFSEFISKYRI